ncbi:MAG: hypothetical protein FRX48_02471 [Lasallia pustulata]|uniref:Uncharacterized protein n=1 Tax=Lasallia pustulata TaxID=136370 RepID=A0A5M8PYJ1_9LECA|nr:MAG: hypothetical protein FRX48_02471 [Lasallia pustulata]
MSQEVTTQSLTLPRASPTLQDHGRKGGPTVGLVDAGGKTFLTGTGYAPTNYIDLSGAQRRAHMQILPGVNNKE